jgi:hypothetical protein
MKHGMTDMASRRKIASTCHDKRKIAQGTQD